MNREELIEEMLLEAGLGAVRGGRPTPQSVERMKRALEVFEQACAPTEAHVKPVDTSPQPAKNGADSSHVTPADAERAALLQAADRMSPLSANPHTSLDLALVREAAYRVADGTFRRTVQGEPTDAPSKYECPICTRDDGPEHSRACHFDEHDGCDRRAEGSDSLPCGCPCHVAKPQGKPTDEHLPKAIARLQKYIDAATSVGHSAAAYRESDGTTHLIMLDDLGAVLRAAATGRESRSSYPTPPCETCGEPVYLTVSGAWRHVERDYAHEAAPRRENGSER